ncbi:MAG: phosphate ABC transporter permease PstA [Planctomycetota bacterium]
MFESTWRQHFEARLAAATVYLGAFLIAGVFVWIVGGLLESGISKLSFSFLTESPSDAGRAGGIFSIIVSTMLILMVCGLAAVPLGVATALMLAEFQSRNVWFDGFVRRSLDLLAGVPSVVFGLFGQAFFAKTLGLGFSILTGGLTLACMVLPILVRSIEVGMRGVPVDYRLGAAALGLTRVGALRRVVFPAAAPAVAMGMVLGLARATAETAALIFTSGYVDRLPESLLDSGRALSVHIYDLTMNVPGGSENAAASALVLLLMLLAMNGLAFFLGKHGLGRGVVSS